MKVVPKLAPVAPGVAPLSGEAKDAGAENVVILALEDLPRAESDPDDESEIIDLNEPVEEDEKNRTVTVDGHDYVLYKRVPGVVKSPYMVRFTFNGKAEKHSFQTNVLKVAKIRARRWIGKIRNAKYADLERMKNRQDASKMEEVVAVYTPPGKDNLNIVKTSNHTAGENVKVMARVLRGALGYADVNDGDRDGRKISEVQELNRKVFAEVRLDKVDGDLAPNYQKYMVRRYQREALLELFKGKPGEKWRNASVPDLEAEVKRQGVSEGNVRMSMTTAKIAALRSSIGNINQARCLFRAKGGVDLIPAYEKAGLRVPPCVKDFLDAPLEGSKRKPDYNAPPDTVVLRTLRAVEELRETDLVSYLCFWMALGAGLRKSEIDLMDWEYFQERDGKPCIVGAIGKNHKVVAVRLDEFAWEKIKPFRQKEGRVVGKTTADQFAKNLNQWMTQQGWRTEKKMHELRALRGSLLYKVSPNACKNGLRHASVKTSETSYLHWEDVLDVPNVLRQHAMPETAPVKTKQPGKAKEQNAAALAAAVAKMTAELAALQAKLAESLGKQ